jgi:hypothetical protein
MLDKPVLHFFSLNFKSDSLSPEFFYLVTTGSIPGKHTCHLEQRLYAVEIKLVNIIKVLETQNTYSGTTVKLGYNEHAWDRPNLFVITGLDNRVS